MVSCARQAHARVQGNTTPSTSSNSPYRETLHKAGSGELSRTCRNRHCPKCQGLARAEWLEARQAELLPVPYYHVVFTLPAPAAEIAFQNKRAVYAILFRAAADAMRDIPPCQ